MPPRVESELIAKFFELSPEPMAVIGPGGYMRAVNAALAKLTGYSEDELLARPFLEFIHPDDREAAENAVAERRAGTPNARSTHNRALRKDGSVVWLSWRSILVGDVLFSTAHDMTEEKEELALLAYRATHDALTGLFNRYQFDDRLRHAIAFAERHGVLIHVLMMDLDEFKSVNDTMGHAAGDAVLVEVGRRLSEMVRPSDTLARVGGDEFALLIESEPSSTVGIVAERFMEAMAVPIEIEGRTFQVGLSIGSATYPVDARTPADLVDKADESMYRVKAERRAERARYRD